MDGSESYLGSISLAAEDVVVAGSAKDLDEAGEDAGAADLLVVVGADVTAGGGRSGGDGVGGNSKGGGREGEGRDGSDELHGEGGCW